MDNTAVLFTNWSGADFTHKWNGQDWSFKAGQSIMLQSYLANHFAKHLAEREMEKANVPPLTRRAMASEFISRCFSGEEVEAESALELETKILNTNTEAENTCQECEQKFKTLTGLKTHMTRMHAV